MAKTKKKNYLIILLFVLLISITVGYAAFSQTLTINGTATANGNFKLKFTNATIDDKVGVSNDSAASISANGDVLTIAMKLEYPGAGGIVNARITNSGSIPAELESIDFSGNDDQDIIISYNESELQGTIAPDEYKDVVITVRWNENSTEAKVLNFDATLNYVQSTTNFSQQQDNNG